MAKAEITTDSGRPRLLLERHPQNPDFPHMTLQAINGKTSDGNPALPIEISLKLDGVAQLTAITVAIPDARKLDEFVVNIPAFALDDNEDGYILKVSKTGYLSDSMVLNTQPTNTTKAEAKKDTKK